MRIIEGQLIVDKSKKVAIIAGRFNHIITDRLIEGAKDAYSRHGGDIKNVDLILVPGAFELPLALNKVLSENKYDAVCCLERLFVVLHLILIMYQLKQQKVSQVPL